MRLQALFSLSAVVASVSAQYTNQTGPFNLQLISDDQDLNGVYLGSCHEGAAIESLCPLNTTAPSSPNFYYNYTDTPTFVSTSGYLTFLLQGANFAVYEPLSLSYNPASNVALPLFEPSDQGQLIGFDDSDQLYIPAYIDDTQNPINATGSTQAYYRWYVCTTYYTGYTYQTLAWVLGEYPPQNPTCCAVTVKRVSA